MCANSSIICVSAILGACCGGPIGGVIATGLTTPIAILVETKIAGTIKDPQLQAQFEEATIGRYLYETLLNVVTLGAAEYLGGYIAAVAGKVTAEMLGEVAERFAERVGALSKNAASSLLKKYVHFIFQFFMIESTLADWRTLCTIQSCLPNGSRLRRK